MLDLELRPYRDFLRLRQRLVRRRSGAQCSIQTILEKYNQPSPEDLPPLPAIEASMHAERIVLLKSQIKEIEKTLEEVLLPLAPVPPQTSPFGRMGSSTSCRYWIWDRSARAEPLRL